MNWLTVSFRFCICSSFFVSSITCFLFSGRLHCGQVMSVLPAMVLQKAHFLFVRGLLSVATGIRPLFWSCSFRASFWLLWSYVFRTCVLVHLAACCISMSLSPLSLLRVTPFLFKL